jgi:cobaltochelatase CobS
MQQPTEHPLQPIRDVFAIEVPETLGIEVRLTPHPMIPAIHPDYIFRRELISDLLAWMRGASGTDALYLSGPTGAGKSSLVTQTAARLGIPLYVVSCHERMEIPELFGRYVVRSGTMQWQDGPLIAGLKDPAGAWILLDEVDTLDPGTFVGLHALLEGRSILLPETGEVIDPRRQGARILCAGNTAGGGDASGLYQATKRQNLATMGRFMILEVGYAEPAEELRALAKAVPAIPEAIRQKMVALAGEIRRLFIGGQLEVTMCTRSLIRWASLSSFYQGKPGVNPLTYALDRALGFRAETESKQALHELCQRIFG